MINQRLNSLRDRPACEPFVESLYHCRFCLIDSLHALRRSRHTLNVFRILIGLALNHFIQGIQHLIEYTSILLKALCDLCENTNLYVSHVKVPDLPLNMWTKLEYIAAAAQKVTQNLVKAQQADKAAQDLLREVEEEDAKKKRAEAKARAKREKRAVKKFLEKFVTDDAFVKSVRFETVKWSDEV